MPKSVNTADEYEFVDHAETALSSDAIAKIREWLQPTDYLADSGEFRRHLLSQAPGTGLWVCQTDDYRNWHDSSDHGSLWIKGVPGAGKSVTAASIIQHLRVTEDCPVLFFFFRNIVAANFSPRALIQDWLAQLLPYSPKLQYALQPLLKTSLQEISDNDLIQIFLDAASNFSRLYCVADALDEMSADNRLFLERLNGLATYRPRSLKLLLTSRPKQYLQSALRDSSIVHISLQQRLVDADIASYLKHRFDVAPISANQRQAKQQVVDMVARRSEGLFLYAKLTMDQVEASMLSEQRLDVKALEESLPVGLEEMYTSVLSKQREEYGITTDVQVLVLEAVTHASRPLRLYELASLIKCVYPDIATPPGFKVLITTSCGPLVEILEDETLQVIHHSFTEFLRGDTRSSSEDGQSVSGFPTIDSAEAHKRMAINCLRYLQSGSLLLDEERSSTSNSDPSITFIQPQHQIDPDKEHYRRSHLGIKDETDPFVYREARLLHPFLHYAVENWSYHASHYDVDDAELFTAIQGFLNADSLAFRRWLVLQWGSTSKTKDSTEGLPTALHIAAYSGLTAFAYRLIQQGLSVSVRDAQDRIPLHWAAANGHTTVAALLIQHGSEPNAEDGVGLKPIHLAARKNHASVVTTLLKAGVKPETPKTKHEHAGRLLGGEMITIGQHAVLYASQGGHTETVIAMIPFCSPETLEELLCECCQYGRADAVIAILDKSDVSPDATFNEATALYFACGATSPRCVQALIRRGADVKKMSTYYPQRMLHGPGRVRETAMAPLHHLVCNWWSGDQEPAYRAIFDLLVKAGADLEQLDGLGNTALLIAAGASIRSHTERLQVRAIQALLEAGADAKKTLVGGDTALHLALQMCLDFETVKRLLEHGIDPNSRGSGGKTALHCCLGSHRMGPSGSPEKGSNTAANIVRYLLEHGADPDIRDKHNQTAVVFGMSANPEVFQMLLARCQDQSIKRQCWFSLSSVHNADKFTTYLELLLAEGMDIDTKGGNGRTLFLMALNSNWRILRSHGADVDAVDSGGNNALHILCQSSGNHRERMEQLIADGGLNPLSTNKNGNTLLHHVASWYTRQRREADFVQWLVSLGIPVNAQNKQGSTPLHLSQTASPFQGSSIVPRELVNFVNAINGRKEVDFSIRDNNGLTALHMAAMRSGIQLATLVAAGADIGILTADQQNVLHLSCRARQSNIVGQILDQPGSVKLNQKDSFGRTPLHYACSSGEPESASLLLKHGADINAVATDGQTALHACAAFRAEEDIWNVYRQRYSWLRGPPPDPLRPGASGRALGRREPWYQSRYGARYAATKPGIQRTFFPSVTTTVKLLLHHGINIASVDQQGSTALDTALQQGCAEVAEVFTDEELFAKVTKHLDENQRTAPLAKEIRQTMKVEMLLLQPTTSLPLLQKAQLMESASMHLDMMTCEDAAKMINDGFKSDPSRHTHLLLLKQLMQSAQMQVAERVSSLVLHYSAHSSIMAWMESTRKEPDYHNYEKAFTTLQLACESKNPNLLMLQLLVERLHVDVNARSALLDQDRYSRTAQVVPGGTALHVLASADSWWQVEGIRYLLAHGASIDITDQQGRTPLHIAACGMREERSNDVQGFWRPEAVRILLDHGADPNALDKAGQSPLHKASVAPDIMRELLRRGADTSLGVRSPLFMAIFNQNLGALEVLLDHGVDVNSIDTGRHSRHVNYKLTESRTVYALLSTAYAEQINHHVPQSAPLLRSLVMRGADLYVPLNDKETMVHFLFEFPEHIILDTLLQEPCVSRIDFNRRDQRGRTVLIAACDWTETLPGYNLSHWDPKIAGPPLRILDQGADATLLDNDGRTALHHLLNNRSMPDEVIIQFINRKEVAPTLLVKDKDGFLPFHYALRILRPGVCNLLLSKGANLLEPDPNGLTVLHYIAMQCLMTSRPRSTGALDIDLPKDYFGQCMELWQKYITEGGSINVKDDAGNTPLLAYMASPDMKKRRNDSDTDDRPCHIRHYDKLFPPDSGVDVLSANKEGETALHVIARRDESYYTKEGHNKDLFVAMVAKGLDPLREDAKGRSALDVASACEKDDIVGIMGRK